MHLGVKSAVHIISMLHVRVHSRLFTATTVLHTLDSKLISIPLLHLVVEHLHQPLQVVQIHPAIKKYTQTWVVFTPSTKFLFLNFLYIAHEKKCILYIHTLHGTGETEADTMGAIKKLDHYIKIHSKLTYPATQSAITTFIYYFSGSLYYYV